MAALELLVGNYNSSSWSLRPWLVLQRSGLEFETQRLPFHAPDWRQRVLAWSPAGKVPVLRHAEIAVWDSLAICEYVAELASNALWPHDRATRAHARSVTAEMHAGFPNLRRHLPMDITARQPLPELSPDTRLEIERVVDLIADCRRKYGTRGPFLFGAFSIADAFYAPVCTRFRTYGVALPADVQDYVDALLATPELRTWEQLARQELANEPATAAASRR
jgi:glutathione S-transferase